MLNAPTANTALLLEEDGHYLKRRCQSISALLEFRAAAELREKDARIRELEGDVEERDRQMAWALKSSKTKDVLRRQMAENKRAALARSSEVPK
jgi:hypothetical protein